MPYESPINQIHISLDIETLGIGPGHKILSIGAKEIFIPNNPREFYIECSRSSQDFYFLREDSDTLTWWSNQKIRAPGCFENEPGAANIVDAMAQFFEWVKSVESDRRDLVGDPKLKSYIWAKSPSFDCAMMREVYKRVHIETPWDFRNEMDVRTALLMASADERAIEFIGTPHHALHDAKHQARIVEYCYRLLGLL